jgi:Tat protein secretion system quality control protein TatD with DNase activity
MQLGLAKKYHLPLFLHSRAAHEDFVKILRDEGFGNDGGRDVGGKGGVVHSFTGSIEEAQELVSELNVLRFSAFYVNRLDGYGILHRVYLYSL